MNFHGKVWGVVLTWKAEGYKTPPYEKLKTGKIFMLRGPRPEQVKIFSTRKGLWYKEWLQ